jgi:L-ascorbate metabolism protein UlaG (beta-lactamase superfamily)
MLWLLKVAGKDIGRDEMASVSSRMLIRELVLPAGTGQPDVRQGSIFFIGTATVILRYAGFTILTDPNFLHKGEQVHLGYGLHSTRLTNPAIDIDALPEVNLVLLSHMHEDHFDRLVMQKLNKTLPVVTTQQAAEVLTQNGFTATYPLATWHTLTITKGEIVLRITAVPAKHAPGFLSNLLPPVNGSMLDFQTVTGQMLLRMYITGDTIPFDRLKEIPQRYPDIDLALFHLGGTRVFGVYLTMTGKQGAELLKLINPETTIPIHCNDYTVFKSPLSDFIMEVEKAGLSERVQYLSIGESYTFEVS